MKTGLRVLRSVLFLIPAIIALTTDISLSGLSIVFGAVSLSAAFVTLIHLFIHFDQKINEKLIMEFVADIFFGIVLFTYPLPSGAFFLIIFSGWLFVMGILLLSSGLISLRKESLFGLYMLAGISYMTMAFVIMNYNPDLLAMISYVLGIVLLTYSVINIFLLSKRKTELYEAEV